MDSVFILSMIIPSVPPPDHEPNFFLRLAARGESAISKFSYFAIFNIRLRNFLRTDCY